MGRKAKVISPSQITTKNLTSRYYTEEITCECVGSKRHRMVFSPSELADGPPICKTDNCGMPMLVVKAETRLEVKDVNIKISGRSVIANNASIKDIEDALVGKPKRAKKKR